MGWCNQHWKVLVLAWFLAISGVCDTAFAHAPKMSGNDLEILDALQTHYRRIRAYQVVFRQKTTASAAASLTTEATGRLFYLKPQRMRWEYESPDQQVFCIVGPYVWIYTPEDHQVQFFDPKQVTTSPVMETLLNGFFDLERFFDVKLEASQTTAKVAVFQLTPKNKKDPLLPDVRIWIDKESLTIVRLRTRDALGNTNELTFSMQHDRKNFPRVLFEPPDKPEIVYIDPDGRVLSPQEIRQKRASIRHWRQSRP